MAWRYDSNSGDLIIDGFDKGIGNSPYNGHQQIIGNITGVPGEVTVGYPLTSATVSGATLGQPISRATYTIGGAAVAYLMLDATGNIFVSTSITGTWSSTSAVTTSAQVTDSVIAWKGYVFHFRNGNIDYATINSGGSVGSWGTGTNWKTSVGNAAFPSFAFVGRDDVLYFCNGPFVGSIIENAGSTFDPASSSTYTYNNNALALPSYELATYLEEQGLNLLIGTTQDTVYVWDRISPTFSNRIFLADRYVAKMVKINTNVLIFCGSSTTGGRGRVFITNGSQADLFFKIPDFITNRQDPLFIWGDAIYRRNAVIFSAYAQTNNPSPTVLLTFGGIYSFDLNTKALSQISPLSASEYAPCLIGDTSNSAGGQSGMGYMAGLYNTNSTTYRIAYSNTAAGTGTGLIQTDYIPVGNFLNKRTFQSVEYKLRSGLASGESITLQMVDENSNSYTLGTDTTVGKISNVFKVGLQSSQWIYLVVSMTGNSATSGVRLYELRFHP